jgi:AcrR family transcriptional regulator
VARPKSYDRTAALIAARDLFWERGYEATSIAELEQRMGLNRSSIYQDFGSKHALFEEALACYADRVISRLHEGLRDDDAGLDTAAGLFRRLAGLLRANARLATRGCLMVNSTAELAARDERVRPAAAAYRDRLRGDFTAALTRAADHGAIAQASVVPRANMLASTLMGIWLSVRIDPLDAADLSDTVATEITAWDMRKDTSPQVTSVFPSDARSTAGASKAIRNPRDSR